MTTERTGGVGLSHPTVVPAGEQGDERESDRGGEASTARPARCPECGRPVADHDRTGR